MAVKAYPKGIAAHDKSDWDDGGNVYYVILLQAGSYNNAHEYVADLLGADGVELTAGGYTHQPLGSRTSQVSGANVILDGADLAYGNLAAGQTIASAVVCRQAGASRNNATDRLIGFYDGGTPPNAFGQTTNGGPVDLLWPTSGILQYQT